MASNFSSLLFSGRLPEASTGLSATSPPPTSRGAGFPLLSLPRITTLLALLIIMCASSFTTNAHPFYKTEADTVFPTPPKSNKLLFYVQRTSNTNTIVYELNEENGKLDKENPIHPFWIRYQEQGQTEELNYIQRTFAYGINVEATSDSRYQFNFVSYKKFKLYLEQTADKLYHVYTITPKNKKKIILNRVFVKITGGSFWFPTVEYIELRGLDVSTNKEIIERFKP